MMVDLGHTVGTKLFPKGGGTEGQGKSFKAYDVDYLQDISTLKMLPSEQFSGQLHRFSV